jgi:hypothetical protein
MDTHFFELILQMMGVHISLLPPLTPLAGTQIEP